MNTFEQFRILFWRGFKQGIRPYPAMIPELVLPFFFFLVNSTAFAAVSALSGFGYESYEAFYAPVALLTAIFISSGSTGLEVVTDISTGFMDRMFVAPVNRWFIIFSKVAAIGVKTTLMTALMAFLFFLLGADYPGGILGVLFMLIFAFIFGMGWAGIGLTLAFKTKNPRVVQSAFVLFFPFSFITTSQMPLNLLSGWYNVAVQINPVTYVLEGMRAALIGADFGQELFIGLGVASAFALITLTIATRSFHRSIVKQ